MMADDMLDLTAKPTEEISVRDVFGIDTDRFKLLRLRGVKTTPLAKTGDAENYMVNTEWTLKCEQEAANFALRDLQAA